MTGGSFEEGGHASRLNRVWEGYGGSHVADIENTFGQPHALVQRKFFEVTQPTVMSRAGFHSLPPVHSRTPISEQYALGILHPDLSFNQVDPVTWRGPINGTVSPLQGPQERAELRASLRERRLDQWDVVDTGREGLPTIPGSPNAV